MESQSSTSVLSPADILTPQELAARLKVKPGWIYEKMRPRQPNPLPVIKMGRFLRFSWPAVAAWLAAQQRNMPKPRKAA
jgi:predicted DNA-binding transcriptional regulator AlpA